MDNLVGDYIYRKREFKYFKVSYHTGQQEQTVHEDSIETSLTVYSIKSQFQKLSLCLKSVRITLIFFTSLYSTISLCPFLCQLYLIFICVSYNAI